MEQGQIQQPTTQPAGGQTQPISEQETTSIWKKWWFWLIIALVVIGAGVGAYFLFFTS